MLLVRNFIVNNWQAVETRKRRFRKTRQSNLPVRKRRMPVSLCFLPDAIAAENPAWNDRSDGVL